MGALPRERLEQLALGAYHTCALAASGHVACWGDNQQGQLGDGSDHPSATPRWVPGLDDVVELRASDAATCARRRSGSVACWGGNTHGEAAPGAPHRAAPTPAARPPSSSAAGSFDRSGEAPSFSPGAAQRSAADIAELVGVRAIAMGARHGCALHAEGSVTCWGDATQGQLGPGSADAFQRRAVAGLPPLVELSAAGVESCGRTASGDVWCWGGAPGAPPARVAGVAAATRLQTLAGRSCAWNASGDVTCWGDSGACADTRAPAAPAPVADYRGSLALARAAGGCFWCVLQPNHALSCDAPPPEPGHIRIADVRAVVAGNDHACAVRDDGSAWCWGSNVRGELGRATPEPRDPTPAPVQWAR